MEKMGWNPSAGLGSDGSGITTAIKATIRQDGVGMQYCVISVRLIDP